MKDSLSRNKLRLLAGALLVALVWACVAEQGWAQQVGTVKEEVAEGGVMGFIEAVLRNLFNSRGLMEVLGQPSYTIAAFVTLNVIVFVETGLLVGFFLPGDSLLVTAGLICASPICGWNLYLLLGTLCASAIVGDTVGYAIGFKTGPRIFKREKSFFFNKDHLLKAQEFYVKHGGKTIIMARFIPILRTFAPVVAGVGRMEYHRFLLFNVFGGIGWVCSMILFGRFLPSVLNPLLEGLTGRPIHVEDHVEKVVILVVIVSVLPMVFAWLRSKVQGASEAAASAKPQAAVMAPPGRSREGAAAPPAAGL
jgi:membrane-associated protein